MDRNTGPNPAPDARTGAEAVSPPAAPQSSPASAPTTTGHTGSPAETAPKPAAGAAAEPREKPVKDLTPEQLEKQRRKRGSLASGALAMPIITLGATLMAVPLGIWYVSTLLKTVIVVITNAVSGEQQAAAVNDALANVDPDAMSSISLALIIIGAVLVLAAIAISWFMLRAHDIERPMLVTVFSVPMAAVLSAVVTISIGALGGLLFRDATRTLEGVLGNAPLGIAGFAIAAIVVSVLIGAAVWWWVARIFRTAEPQR